MGSTSDLPVMQDAIDILKSFDIPVEVDIVSAHRTPDKLMKYGKTAADRNIGVIMQEEGKRTLRRRRRWSLKETSLAFFGQETSAIGSTLAGNPINSRDYHLVLLFCEQQQQQH